MRPEQLDASATADGERKTITALFADIKGSGRQLRIRQYGVRGVIVERRYRE